MDEGLLLQWACEFMNYCTRRTDHYTELMWRKPQEVTDRDVMEINREHKWWQIAAARTPHTRISKEASLFLSLEAEGEVVHLHLTISLQRQIASTC